MDAPTPSLINSTEPSNTNEPGTLDDKLMYLAEMFNDLPVETIVDIINTNTTASMQILIDQCLAANNTPFDDIVHSSNHSRTAINTNNIDNQPPPYIDYDFTDDNDQHDNPDEISNTVSWLPPHISSKPVQSDTADIVKHLPPPNFMSIGSELYDRQVIVYNSVRQLHIRIGPSNIDTYITAIRLLIKIINNLIQSPDNEKYRLLSLTNAKLYNAVIIVDGCVGIIKSIGFTEIRDNTNTHTPPTMLCITNELYNINLLQYAMTLVTCELSAIQRMIPTTNISIDDDPTYQSLKSLQKQSQKLQRDNKPVPQIQHGISRSKLTREQIAELYEHKLSNTSRNKSYNNKSSASLNIPRTTSSNSTSPNLRSPSSTTSTSTRPISKSPSYNNDSLSSSAIPYATLIDEYTGLPVAHPIDEHTTSQLAPPQQGRISDYNKIKQMKSDIAQMRSNKHSQSHATRYGQKHVFTLTDIEQMRKNDFDIQAKFGAHGNSSNNTNDKFQNVSDYGTTADDMLNIGHECLRLTNIFRAENNLSPLTWHQSLYEIGMTHSADMAEGRVEFGHDGFQERRVSRYPFNYQSAAENVAWNQGMKIYQVYPVNNCIDILTFY